MAGTADLRFHRNRILMELFKRADLEIDLRTVRLWGEREQLIRSGKLCLLLRALWFLPLAFWRLLRAPSPDVLFVGYPGHLDMPWLAPLAKLRGFPVIFDPFISLFDTAAIDRRLVSAESRTARLLRAIDCLACRLADIILADTPAHAEFLAQLTGVPRERFRIQWVGAEERLFYPWYVQAEPELVLFYGTYIPLHGIDTIIRAAKILERDEVRIKIIGQGQQRGEVESLVSELGVHNVELAEPVPLESLPSEIARASVCLGIFGTTPKALRVIPNKVFQSIAMARPVVTSDSPAIRAAFETDELVLIPAGDPKALARAIRMLVNDPETAHRVARAGYKKFSRQYSLAALTRLLESHFMEAAARGRSRRRNAVG